MIEQLYTYQSGPASAPAIVFVHGGGLTGRMWQPQLERLTEFHCLAPDLPQQGKSAAIGPFTLENAASHLAALIRARAPNGKAVVVGLSVGGAVVLALLRVAPEVVNRAIISGATPGLGKVLAAINRLNEPVIRLLKPHQIANLIMRQFNVPPRYKELLSDDFKGLTPELFNIINNALVEVPLPTGPVPPTLVVVGEKETFLARRHARKVVATVPGTTGRLVPGVNHGWNFEAPDLFCEMVRAWATDSPLPASVHPLN